MKIFHVVSVMCFVLSMVLTVAAGAVHFTGREKGLGGKNTHRLREDFAGLPATAAALWLCDYHLAVFGEAMGVWLCAALFMAQSVLTLFLAGAVRDLAADFFDGRRGRFGQGGACGAGGVDLCASGRAGADRAEEDRENRSPSLFVWIAATFLIICETAFFSWPLIGRTRLFLKWISVLSCAPGAALLIWFLLRLAKSGRDAACEGAKHGRPKPGRIRCGQGGLWHMTFAVLMPVFLSASTVLSLRQMKPNEQLFYYEDGVRGPLWLIAAGLCLYFAWNEIDVREQGALADRTRVVKYKLKDMGTALSDRELDIASLICQGKSNKEIAQQLYLSPNTVKVHASNLYKKIGANNRAQAAQLLTVMERERNGKTVV